MVPVLMAYGGVREGMGIEVLPSHMRPTREWSAHHRGSLNRAFLLNILSYLKEPCLTVTP